MAYSPPFSGGHFNATIGGNTTGTGALVSSGTFTLAGGNNITLSQNGNAVSVVGANAAAGSNTLGMSTVGNTAGATGVVSGSGVQYLLAGGNNITLNQSLNGVSGTLSISAANQTNQTMGMYAIGNTTQSTSGTVDARSLSFDGLGAVSAGISGGTVQLSVNTQTAQTQSNVQALYDGTNSISTGTVRLSNSNGVSFGISGQTLTASVSQSNPNLSFYATGNTTQNTSAQLNVSSLMFNGLGGASVGYTNGSIELSVPAVSVNGSTSNISFANANNVTFGGNASTITASASFNQTNQTMGMYAIGNTTQSTSGTVDARSLSFDGLGAVSAGISGGTVQLSVNTQTNQTLGMTATGGNTLSNTTATFDARSLIFSGLGNVSVGYSSGTIEISGSGGGGAAGSNTLGMSTVGNTAGATGVVSGSGVQYLLAGGNNITLNQSLNGVSGTLSISAANQTNQTLSMSFLGNTTGGTNTTTIDARSLSISGAGAVSAGYSSSTMIISAATQTNQTMGMYAIGSNNTIGQSSTTTLDARSMNYSGQGALSLGFSGSTMQLSAPAVSSISATGALSVSINGSVISLGAATQTNQTLSMSFLGNTTGGTNTTTIDARSLSISGAGAVSAGYSSSTMIISAATQTNQTMGMYAIGNTTQSTSGTVDARSLSFDGLGAVSAGISGGTVQLSVNTQTNQTLGMTATGGNTLSNTTATFDARSLIFSGLGNVSVGYSSGTIEISGSGGGGGGVALAYTNTTFATGTVDLVNAGGALTMASSTTTGGGQSINFSIPQTSSLSATGAVSISTNGSTISIGAPVQTAVTLSYFEPYPMQNASTAYLSANTNTSGAASFIPFIIPENVAVGYLNMIENMSMATGGTSSYNQAVTVQYGIYSRGTGGSSTSLSQVAASSWLYSHTWNNSTISVSQPTSSATSGYGYGLTNSNGTNMQTGYTGLKMVQMPISSVFTPGQYWLGIFERASTNGSNLGILRSYVGNNYTLNVLAPMGSGSGSYSSGTNILGGNGNWMVGFGSYISAAGQTNLPSTVALSSMTQNTTMSVIPYMKFVVS